MAGGLGKGGKANRSAGYAFPEIDVERVLKSKWVLRASVVVVVALTVSNIYLLHALSVVRNHIVWVESVAQTAKANAVSGLNEGRDARHRVRQLKVVVSAVKTQCDRLAADCCSR